MILRFLKYFLLFLLVVFFAGGIYVYNYAMDRLAPRPSMMDSPTSFIGFNHIGISVMDIDEMIAFYQSATDFELIKRYTIKDNDAVNALFGYDSISYETAVLKGPNMLLELTEFDHQTDAITKMPPFGPGMTHTCYQTPEEHPAYDLFKNAGADIISRGDEPIGSSSIRVSYAYAYDLEGNMMELEHMPSPLIRLAIGTEWAEEHLMWMTQVALISPDIKRLTAYYKEVLEIEPYRVNSYGPHQLIDDVVDLDNVTFEGVWFGMDTQGKKFELMQYTQPATPTRDYPLKLTDLGYSFSFEVGDIQLEYERLKNKGVNFNSTPQKLQDFWMVFAQDPDGNIFSLRQIIDKASPLSLKNM